MKEISEPIASWRRSRCSPLKWRWSRCSPPKWRRSRCSPPWRPTLLPGRKLDWERAWEPKTKLPPSLAPTPVASECWRPQSLLAPEVAMCSPRRGDSLVARPRSCDGLVACPQSGDGLAARPPSGDGLVEVATVSLFASEVATVSSKAESPPEAAAVGPRGDQAVVGGGGLL